MTKTTPSLSLSLKHAHTQKKALCFKLLFFLVCFSRKLKIQKPFLGFTIIFLELHNFGNFVPPFCSLLSSLNFWFNIFIFFFGETFFLSFYPANSVFFFLIVKKKRDFLLFYILKLRERAKFYSVSVCHSFLVLGFFLVLCGHLGCLWPKHNLGWFIVHYFIKNLVFI